MNEIIFKIKLIINEINRDDSMMHAYRDALIASLIDFDRDEIMQFAYEYAIDESSSMRKIIDSLIDRCFKSMRIEFDDAKSLFI